MSNIVKLKDVSEIIMGQSPDSSTYNSIGNGIPFFQGKRDFGKIYPTATSYCTKPKKTVLANDILISVRAPVGDLNLAREKSCIGRGLSAIRVKDNILDNMYLFRYLQKQKNIIANKGNGSTFNSIRKVVLEDLDIPLPSLTKQKEIASVLDKAQELISLRKESIKKLDELSKSVFIDMFGDPVLNPKKLEIIKFGNLGLWKGGGTPSRKEEDYFKGNIPWITTVSLGKLFIDKNDAVEYITEKAIQKSATKLIEKNSLVIGVRVGVGKVSINKDDLCTSQDLMSLTNMKDNTNIIYAYYFISLYSQIIKDKQRGATIQGITSSVLKEIDFILAPIEQQNKFAKIIEKIEEQKSLYEEELNKLEENFKALLQKSFN